MSYTVAIDLCIFTEEHGGGKDEVAYNLLRGFEKLGVSRQILCFCYKGLAQKIRKVNPNVGIHVVPRIPKYGPLWRLRPILRGVYERHMVKKLGIRLLVFSAKPSPHISFPIPTVEIPHDIQALEAGHIRGIDAVPAEQNYIIQDIKLDFRYRDHIVAISDYDRDSMLRNLPWAADKITRIYDPIRFTQPPVDQNCRKEYITVLNIMHPHKNTETALRAFRRIAEKTDLKLALVGREPRHVQQLKDYVARHGLEQRVIFTGFVSNETLSEIIEKTRIYVNPSFFEGFGMTAVEMMGREIPTIVADSTAMPEVTRGLCRYYGPADDDVQLAAVLLEELEHPTPPERLAEIAQVMRETYSYVKAANEYWDFFQSCMRP